jgi:DNA-binding CsgD family transcriptional regulator
MDTRTASGWSGLFEVAFSRSQNAMALTDDTRRLIEINAAFARLLARRPSELRGRRIYDFVAGGPLLSGQEWERALAVRETTGEATLMRPDGSDVRIQYAAHPEVVTGRRLMLFVALARSRWGRHFRRALPRTSANGGRLTGRESEVVHLVALGATSSEIAAELQISENTVRKHVGSAMTKLGARSRAHLVAKALAEDRHKPPPTYPSEPSTQSQRPTTLPAGDG